MHWHFHPGSRSAGYFNLIRYFQVVVVIRIDEAIKALILNKILDSHVSLLSNPKELILMKKSTSFMIFLPIAFVIILVSMNEVYGQQSKAVEGLESMNTVVDFRKDNPKEVATYLNLIHQTYMGVKMNINENTDFVIVFTGPVVKLLYTNKDGSPSEKNEIVDTIADKITAMAKDGIKMDICMFAAASYGISPESVFPEIKQVQNGWLSLIGYQAMDYSLLPVY